MKTMTTKTIKMMVVVMTMMMITDNDGMILQECR